MTAYYNENDPEAAVWLSELIARGMLPDGVVDTRSIVEVMPYDIKPFTQCHFFAGIGGWPAALKWLVGWPDSRPVWTGSCPCQPFSAAGKGKGFDDERHLWPSWFHLIRVCRPVAIFGEQVDKATDWLDLIQDDLEGEGFAFGAADLCASGVSAPHIRQRLFWGAYDLGPSAIRMADVAIQGRAIGTGHGGDGARGSAGPVDAHGGSSHGLHDADHARLQGHDGHVHGDGGRSEQSGSDAAPSGPGDGLVDADGYGFNQARERVAAAGRDGDVRDGGAGGVAYSDVPVSELTTRTGAGSDGSQGAGSHRELDGCGELPKGRVGTVPIDGWWRNADWLFGRDGKFRPVESGTFPLGNGIPHRVGLLRGYGNAIVPQLAAEFVKAFEESK